MALYKNYKPNDFAKLHNNEGIIYSIFSNDYKNDILSNITFELESKIQELTEKIESINSNTVSSIEELNSIYLYYL